MFWCFEGVCVHPQKLDNSFESCASKSNNLGRPLEIKFGYTSKTRLKSAMNGPWPWHWKFPNILPNITNAIRHETSKIYPSCSIQVSHGKNRSPRFGPNFFKACWRKKNSGPAAVQRSGCSLPSVLSMVSMQRRYRSSASESSPSSSKTSLLQLAIGCLKEVADEPMVDIW
jgi:hypothetical protein